MSNIILIKPLSVNEAWKGRRFKTDAYKSYRHSLSLMLPKIHMPEGSLSLTVDFGFSSNASDVDNPLKPFIDALQDKYEFNDNQIYEIRATKRIVSKGDEYIKFNIEAHDDKH